MSRARISGNVERYHRGREKLIEQLGGKCAACGTGSRLEFDHKKKREWEPSKTSRWVRLARYRREAALGLIQLLCRSCNASKGQPMEL